MIDFKNLLGLDSIFPSQQSAAPTAESEASAREERIKFHRAKVRNGPVSFTVPTNGQIRRAEQRRKDKAIKRNRRREVRNYFAMQREAAILRGQLQAVGALPYGLGTHAKISPHGAHESVSALVKRYVTANPEVLVDYDPDAHEADLIQGSLQDALNRWSDLVGLPRTTLGTSA